MPNISGRTKEEVLANFKDIIHTCTTGSATVVSDYSCHNKCKRCDTVDGNPQAATKMCYPYPRANIRKQV